MRNSNVQKRVYFLGAGASKASDFDELPTMNKFFREEDFTGEEYQNLHDFIKKVFPNTKIRELNLEDVVTRLELSMDKFGAFGEHPEPYLYEARREFSRYVHERLTYEPKDGRRWCEKHKVLLEQLYGKDSIITLNYDRIVDYTLNGIRGKSTSKGLRLGEELLDQRHAGFLPDSYKIQGALGHYLKLHGSIDWIYCKNSTCGNHQHFFPKEIGCVKRDISPGSLCNLCGSPLVSVIIPPTMNKTFNEYPKLGLLWSLAFREIRDADELVLIGMSLPDSDYYLKWLINSAVAFRENKSLKVVVVNPDKTVCDKIEKLMGVWPEYHDDFRKYVDSIKK